MMQLKPEIIVLIDQAPNTTIISKVCFWFLCLIIIMVMSLRGQSQFIKSFAHPCLCYPNSKNMENSESSINCTLVFTMPTQGINKLFLQLWVQVNKVIHFSEYKTGLYEQKIFFHTPLQDRSTKEIFPITELQFMTASFNNLQPENLLPLTNLTLNEKIQFMEKQGFEILRNSYIANISLECRLNVQNSHHIECLSEVFEQVRVTKEQQIVFFINIKSKKYTDGYQLVKFLVTFDNINYGRLNLFFQVACCIITLSSFIMFYCSLKRYPREHWLDIHKWTYMLQILLFFFNLPYQLMYGGSTQILYEFLQSLTNLTFISYLYFFWLYSLERNTEKIGIFSIMKILIIVLYTLPQFLIDGYILYKVERDLQFDPFQEISSYGDFINVQLIFFAVYTGVMISFSLKILLRGKEVKVETENNSYNAHDPFSSELQGTSIEVQEKKKNFGERKPLLFMNIFVLIIDTLLQAEQLLHPLNQKTYELVGRSALLSIYLHLVSVLYAPINYSESVGTEENLSDEQIEKNEILKNVYGQLEIDEEIEQSHQHQERSPSTSIDRDKLWRNIQKQLEEENQDLDSEEEL